MIQINTCLLFCKWSADIYKQMPPKDSQYLINMQNYKYRNVSKKLKKDSG